VLIPRLRLRFAGSVDELVEQQPWTADRPVGIGPAPADKCVNTELLRLRAVGGPQTEPSSHQLDRALALVVAAVSDHHPASLAGSHLRRGDRASSSASR